MAASILAGLRAGHCFISASPSGPQIYVQCDGACISIRIVDGDGATLQAISRGETIASVAVTSPDWTTTIRYPADAQYVRFQLADASGQTLAFSNPIWTENEAS